MKFVAGEVTTRRKSNKRSVRTTEKQRMLEKRKNKEDYKEKKRKEKKRKEKKRKEKKRKEKKRKEKKGVSEAMDEIKVWNHLPFWPVEAAILSFEAR